MRKKFLSALMIGGILIMSVPVEAENRVEVAEKIIRNFLKMIQ